MFGKIKLIHVGLVALLALGLLAACREAPTDSAEPTPVLNTVAVNTGVDTVSAEAVVVPLRSAQLAFVGGGRVAELLVAEGAAVDAGQPLVRLAAAELEAARNQADVAVTQAEIGVTLAAAQRDSARLGVAAAEANLAAARAQLALVEAPPLAEEIAVLENQIAAAEAAINQADANRDVLAAGANDAQLRSAEAQVSAALAEAEIIQDEYDEIIRNEIGGAPEERVRYRLAAANANLAAARAALAEVQAGPTADELRAAAAGVTAAIANRDAAQAQLALLQVGARSEQIALTATGVDQAQVAVDTAAAALSQAEIAVTQAEAALTGARAARDLAQAQLDQMTLVAPFSGTVSALAIEAGEIAAPGVPVVTLADLSGWQVETSDLSELEVVNVATGFPAIVTFDALPGESITGTVRDISIVAGLNRGDVTYQVVVDLAESGALPLRWGMTAFVDIDVRQ